MKKTGDLHGSHQSLFRLLRRISYTPSHDTLVHTGDVITKSTMENSLATLTMLRKLGAKGVRGNHDQKVIEWRKWMEHLGPLDQKSTKENVVVEKKVKQGKGKASETYEKSLTRDDEEEIDYRIKRMRVMRPKKEKRGWSDWLGSSSKEEEAIEETGQDGIEATTQYEEEEVYSEESFTSSSSSSSSSSEQAKPTDRRRPFGQRPSRLSSSSSAALSRPTSISTTLKSALSNNTTLLGSLWSHLDPNLSSSEFHKLGLKVPTGWEWGDEHFELARHLTSQDLDYLESLPLTLWVEELNSFIVHAGLVPLTSTSPRGSSSSSFTPYPSSLSTLTSFSPLTFVPPSTSSLSSTLRGSLLLQSQNTDPFTLLSMRTLSLVHPSSHDGMRVKGPANEWKVSSRGKKASRNSRPWWSVWEDSIKELIEEEEEQVGIIYGHWASQGLEIQNNSYVFLFFLSFLIIL